MSKQGAASSALARLNVFLGVWATEGAMKSGGPSYRAVRFKAKDTYEWLPGGHFLLHRFDADMPEGKVIGMEVIGYQRDDDSYAMHSYDNAGNAAQMHARVNDSAWTFLGEGVRFTGSFSEENIVFSGLWEMRASNAAAWSPWMEITLRKVT